MFLKDTTNGIKYYYYYSTPIITSEPPPPLTFTKLKRGLHFFLTINEIKNPILHHREHYHRELDLSLLAFMVFHTFCSEKPAIKQQFSHLIWKQFRLSTKHNCIKTFEF